MTLARIKENDEVDPMIFRHDQYPKSLIDSLSFPLRFTYRTYCAA